MAEMICLVISLCSLPEHTANHTCDQRRGSQPSLGVGLGLGNQVFWRSGLREAGTSME